MVNKKGDLIFRSNFWLLCLAIISGALLSCAAPNLEMEGWFISPNIQQETVEIRHAQLGILVREVKLYLNQGGAQIECRRWNAQQGQDHLIIQTQEPQSLEWTFRVTQHGVNIDCSAENGLVSGVAPATRDRIPARQEDQDNGVLYTSLGLVTASNIHCLFDRNTDTMIQFAEKSRLTRGTEQADRMTIAVPLSAGDEISIIPDYYINVLKLKFYKPKPTRFVTAPVAWSSWYCYYMGTTEADMITETDAIAKHLASYGLEYIQLDACYTLGDDANYLDWTKTTFPHGGKWLFEYIKNKGLKPALWVNIYGSNYAQAECADKYPENYYLRDVRGNLSGACCTGDTSEVRLDYTNPEVIEKHLKPMFRILKDEWGLEYLKDAGWGTWMDFYDRNKSMAFDSTRGSREVYLEAQRALRETLGDDVYIGGCAMHEVGLGFDIFDGSRIGADVAAHWYPPKPGDMSMQTFFHSLFGANYLNNITWHCDPDAAMVRNPLSLEEGRTIVTAIALTGQLYMASDFMARLPERKLELYQKTMPTTPIVPIDLYPYRIESNKRDGVVWCCPQVKEFPKAIDLKVNNVTGVYDVAAMFNWSDAPDTCQLRFSADLGLDENKDYVVFDFWEQAYLGKARDQIRAVAPAHGTKTFVIREAKNQPQVLANSRHITGDVSMKAVKWDASLATLSGASEIVPGAPYSLFIHLPNGEQVKTVTADVEVLYHTSAGELLEVKLSGVLKPGQSHTVNWSVAF
ncbi:MAG: alpha-galactosidase [Candidatus Zhuqueibacterota bacterium]